MNTRISPESLIDRSYIKVGDSLEVIIFVDTHTFKHSFPDKNEGFTAHPFRLLDDGLELNWGNGAVATCRWCGPNESSSAFSEICCGRVHQWELEDYFEFDNTGSTSEED
jgi:hypothetical protein